MVPLKKVSRKEFGWVFWLLERRRRASNNYSRALAQCQAGMRALFAVGGPDSRGGASSLDNPRAAHAHRHAVSATRSDHATGRRTTIATPLTVITMPASMLHVNTSPNKAQASNAVQGGTRYIRLVTRVAAPR